MAYVLLFVLTRLYLVFSSWTHWELLPISKGFLYDLSLALLFTFAQKRLLKKKSLQTILYSFVTLLWGFNCVHIMVNGSHIDFTFSQYATHPSFALGSVLSLNTIGFVVLYLLFWLGVHFLISKRNFSLPQKWPYQEILLAVVLFICAAFTPSSVLVSSWVQSNLLVQQWKSSSTSQAKKSTLFLPANPHHKTAPLTLSRPYPQTNILLIVVEALSMGHWNQLKQSQSVFKQKGKLFQNFIASQRQTNRGLFSLLCGLPPNLRSRDAKADILMAQKSYSHCLPHALKTQGYDNTFMQSAPLSFMRKDLFAQVVGFDRSLDYRKLKNIIYQSQWGVDDKTLFENAQNIIKQKNLQTKPWFLTLLTVGTHHPYTIPGQTGRFDSALQYADNALAEFLHWIDEENLFRNTLVIVTSDEAHLEKPLSLLQNNWGFLWMNGPGFITPSQELNFYAQQDLKASLFDYLGLPLHDQYGWSFFRKYNLDRNYSFANVYLDRFFYLKGKELSVCKNQSECLQIPHFTSFASPLMSSVPLSHQKAKKRYEDALQLDWTMEELKSNVLFELKDQLYDQKDFSILEQFKISLKKGSQLKYRFIIDRTKDKSPLPLKVLLRYHDCNVNNLIMKETDVPPGKVTTYDNWIIDYQKDRNICYFFSVHSPQKQKVHIKLFQILKQN